MWPSSSKRQRRREPELLALCLRDDWRASLPRITELAGGETDWQALVDLARQHRVSALLAPVFDSLSVEGIIPEAAAARLRTDSLMATATALHFQSVLEDVLKVLQRESIPVIALKGLALSHLLYAEPHRRPCGDIDILVHEEDYPRLHEALVAAKYAALDDKELPYQSSSLETTFEQHFLAPGGGVQIEVHTDSIKLGVRPAGADAVWQRAVPVRIGSVEALSLSPRDLALMLPIHLHRHGFIRLLWFKDIDLLVRQHSGQIDWDVVIEDARQEGAKSSLFLSLGYAKKLLGTPVPDEALKKMRPGPLTRLIWRRLWPEERVLDLEGVTRRRMVQFAVNESWRGTIPSLLLMGRRWEKTKIILSRVARRKKRPATGAAATR
jgi:hypothetical protein